MQFVKTVWIVLKTVKRFGVYNDSSATVFSNNDLVASRFKKKITYLKRTVKKRKKKLISTLYYKRTIFKWLKTVST